MNDERIIINPPRTPTKKTTKLRVINEGNNRYDVAGKLIQLGRAVRDGKYGKVTDVVVGVRTVHMNGGHSVDAYHFGEGDYIRARIVMDLARRAMGGSEE